MITAFVEPGNLKTGAVVGLDAAEVHHLEVRRAVAGDRIRVMDGAGSVATGVLSLAKKEARVDIAEVAEHPRPPALVLGVGAGDKDRFGWLAEKCAEVGVTDLVPLMTNRSQNVATRVRPEHIEKLSRRALESIKQSGNPYAPLVHRPILLDEYLRTVGTTVKVVAEQGGAEFGPVGREASVTCLVGPEGGWTEQELAELHSSGFTPVRLGEFSLRFETAAVAAAIAVMLGRET